MPFDLLMLGLQYFVLPFAVFGIVLGGIAGVFLSTVLAEVPRHPEMLEDGFEAGSD